MACLGNADDICCYVHDKPCPHIIYDYVDDTGHHRRFACGLRAKYGNWDDVIASSEYQIIPGPQFEEVGINCKDWPTLPGQYCGACGYGRRENR